MCVNQATKGNSVNGLPGKVFLLKYLIFFFVCARHSFIVSYYKLRDKEPFDIHKLYTNRSKRFLHVNTAKRKRSHKDKNSKGRFLCSAKGSSFRFRHFKLTLSVSFVVVQDSAHREELCFGTSALTYSLLVSP